MKNFYFVLVICVMVLFDQSQKVEGTGDLTLDTESGKHYLMYAYAAYCSEGSLSPWNCKWCGPYNTSGFQVTEFVTSKEYNLFGYVGYSDNEPEILVGDNNNNNNNNNNNIRTIIVAFRGTEETSLKNWILNLEASKEPINDPDLPGSKVEDGFYKGWKALENQTLAAIQALISSSSPRPVQLLAIGHSLGGALAFGAAMTTARHYNTPRSQFNVTLITYGQPRVGNNVFADYASKFITSTVRFVNNRDPVPHLPTELMGYRHTPREEWIRKGVLIYCSPTDGEDPNCSDSLDFTLSISDHLDYFGIEEDPSPSPPGSPYPGPCA